MTVQVIWSPSAPRQAGRIYDYLADLNPHAARPVAEALIAAGDGLSALPQRGRSVPNTELRELVAADPYVIR